MRVHETVGDKEHEWINEVCFRHAAFSLVNKKCCDHCRDGFGITCNLSEAMMLGKGVEVIGNIHENSDLL